MKKILFFFWKINRKKKDFSKPLVEKKVKNSLKKNFKVCC